MEEKLKMLVEEPGSVVCECCSGAMRYHGSGKYVCVDCGHLYVTEFGILKAYINEHGPQNAFKLSEATGVSRTKIQRFIREGKIEMVSNPFQNDVDNPDREVSFDK